MDRMSNKNVRRGFTLVEILIVVIILGILASIVVAQFSSVRGGTADTALKDNLRWMRSAIQLYQVEHGRLPTLANFEAQMTGYTDMNGIVGATKNTTYKFGSYMLSLPPLPVGLQPVTAKTSPMAHAILLVMKAPWRCRVSFNDEAPATVRRRRIG